MATIIDTIHRYTITHTNDGRYTTYAADLTKPLLQVLEDCVQICKDNLDTPIIIKT